MKARVPRCAPSSRLTFFSSMAAVPGALVVMALASLAPTAHAQTAVPAPISYYSFDEAAGSTTLFDSIRGTSGNGTLYGFGGSGGAFVPGLVGNALRFNGSSTYVTAPLAGGGLSEYTFSAWVNLDSLTSWAVVLSNWGSATVGANILARNENSTAWADYIGLSNGSYLFATTPSGAVVTNTWTNLITTVSQSAGQGKLYLNGTLVDTQSFSGSINSSKPIMSMGMKLNDANTGPGEPPGYLDGRLDEFAFWDSALSASQVANIYSSGTSGSTPIPVPPSTAYWAPGSGAGGTDTWNGSQGTTFWAPNSNGSGTKQPWNNGLASSVAVFGGTAGTVTTSGTVQSNQLSFTTSGYTVAGGTGSRVDFIGSSPAVRLASGVSTTISANLGGSGPLAISGSGSRGRLNLAGNSTVSGGLQVTNALLSLSGTVQGNVSLASNASLGGTGKIGGAITGAGSVNPGNSPGILTSGSIDPSGGLDFTFEFSGTAPDYANAAASVNDVLRLTGSTPFTAALSSANVVNVLFGDIAATTAEQLQALTGDVWKGAFFTDADSSFLSSIQSAAYRFYLYGDGNGTYTFNGVNYYSLRDIDPEWTRNFGVGTEAVLGAPLAGGAVDGVVTTFTVVVPEPSTSALAALGTCLAGLSCWRRRRTLENAM
jgi:hypothetical protein